MPTPKRYTVAAGEDSGAIPLDHMRHNYQASLLADVLSGAPTYSVQVTGDDVQEAGYDPATGNWQDHSALAGLAASAKGNLDFPATALRLVVTGTGSVRLTILEGGSYGAGR